VRDRQTCVGCGKKSPETETNYTLISAQFGWRLTRYKTQDGALVVEWRCPTCWREFKRARTTPVGDGVGTRGASTAGEGPIDRPLTSVVPAPAHRSAPPPAPTLPSVIPPHGRPRGTR
jgi:hypothetical protein